MTQSTGLCGGGYYHSDTVLIVTLQDLISFTLGTERLVNLQHDNCSRLEKNGKYVTWQTKTET